MIIGLTGGIGAGKSFVAKRLTEKFGILVYDCDAHAKRLMTESNVIRAALVELIGDAVYCEDGSLNKPLLVDYIFNKGGADAVNAIVHPVVMADCRQWTARYEISAVESAILYEAGFDRFCDVVICVTASLETRIRRAMVRDNTSRDQVVARINAQTDIAQKKATIIISNDDKDDIDSAIANCCRFFC